LTARQEANFFRSVPGRSTGPRKTRSGDCGGVFMGGPSRESCCGIGSRSNANTGMWPSRAFWSSTPSHTVNRVFAEGLLLI
jgi:hypothetical protein